MRPPGAWLQGFVAAFSETLEQAVDPAPGETMVAGELSWAAVLQDDGIDDVASEG